MTPLLGRPIPDFRELLDRLRWLRALRRPSCRRFVPELPGHRRLDLVEWGLLVPQDHPHLGLAYGYLLLS